MAGSGPPSFTTPQAETSYAPAFDPYYAADTGPQSFSALNTGRPVSVSHDQTHQRVIDGESNMKRLPTFKDVAPDVGKSFVAPPPTGDTGNANRGYGDVYQDGQKPKTFTDLAEAHKINSGTAGPSPYHEDVKMPSNSDMRPNNRSSGYQDGGYQFSSGPKSYNGDNFGRFTW